MCSNLSKIPELILAYIRDQMTAQDQQDQITIPINSSAMQQQQ
jgi:hypothetical protein